MRTYVVKVFIAIGFGVLAYLAYSMRSVHEQFGSPIPVPNSVLIDDRTRTPRGSEISNMSVTTICPKGTKRDKWTGLCRSLEFTEFGRLRKRPPLSGEIGELTGTYPVM